MPVVKQQFMQIDLDRADFRAVSAERGCIAQVLPFLHFLQMGGNNGADRPAIGGAIAVAADIFIDGAGIETGAAAYTVEAFAGLGIGEYIRPAVVEQDEDHFIGAVRLTGLARAGNDGIIGGHPLTGAIGCQ